LAAATTSLSKCEADKRKKEAEKTKKPLQRRVRLPRVKPKGEN
jgi:hypothetical protein